MIFILFSPALVSRTSFFDTRVLFHTIPAGRQINYITYLVALSCQMIHSISAASPLLPSFFSSIRGQVRGRGLSLTPQGLSASAPSSVPPLSLSFHQNKLHDARSFKNNQPSVPRSIGISSRRGFDTSCANRIITRLTKLYLITGRGFRGLAALGKNVNDLRVLFMTVDCGTIVTVIHDEEQVA